MFNPVDTPKIIMAIGQVLRDAADRDEPKSDYGRSQLLSAYSVARHLAAEEAHASELMAWFRTEATPMLATLADEGPAEVRTRARDAAEVISSAGDRSDVGTVLCELLAALRQTSHPRTADLQRLLRELTELEVDGLSRHPE